MADEQALRDAALRLAIYAEWLDADCASEWDTPSELALSTDATEKDGTD